MIGIARRDRRRRRGHLRAGAAIVLAASATLAVSFLPYIVPFTVTIAEAAAPGSSLRFLFWGAGLFVLPLTLAYAGAACFIVRGPVQAEGGPR